MRSFAERLLKSTIEVHAGTKVTNIEFIDKTDDKLFAYIKVYHDPYTPYYTPYPVSPICRVYRNRGWHSADQKEHDAMITTWRLLT